MKQAVRSFLSIKFIYFVIPTISAILFFLITDSAWEDWYITYRSSKNLAIGNGFDYVPGEHVYSFTSPIGTLLPALIKYLFPGDTDDFVLLIFRILSSIFLGLTGYEIYRITKNLALSVWPAVFLILVFAFDLKILSFSTSGMETAFLMFFIALSIYALLSVARSSSIVLGIGCAGLMWTRPDGCIYILALLLSALIFNPTRRQLPERIKFFGLAALVGGAIYLPWFIWSYSYYGSFVPNSLVAKSLGYNYDRWLPTLFLPIFGLSEVSSFDYTFSPAYFLFGGWCPAIGGLSRMISWLCCFAWLWPRFRRDTRMVSFATMLVQYYLNLAPSRFPWYIPGATLLTAIVAAQLLNELSAKAAALYAAAPRESHLAKLRYIAPAVAITAIASTVMVTAFGAYQLSIQQKVIENDNRKQIGLWLHDHAVSSKDTVFLEPSGYIGFFSNMKLHGFPGQMSPELVAARRATSCFGRLECEATLISVLKPEWLVLRPNDAAAIREDSPQMLDNLYTLEKTFDVSDELASYTFLPGRQWLTFDQLFLVYKRQDSS